jgi:hypothetical protein
MDVQLPKADEIGQMYADYFEIGEPPTGAMEAAEEPGRALDDYRFRLARARRRAIRERLQELTLTINDLLPKILRGVPRDSRKMITDANATHIAAFVKRSRGFSATPPNVEGGGAIFTATCTSARATTGTTSPSSTGPLCAGRHRGRQPVRCGPVSGARDRHRCRRVRAPDGQRDYAAAVGWH